MSARAPVITIDGPSGSGKGTISRLVARALGWHFLDSGALYRGVGVASLRARADIRILDCANVATSFPGFPELAARVGLSLGLLGESA